MKMPVEPQTSEGSVASPLSRRQLGGAAPGRTGLATLIVVDERSTIRSCLAAWIARELSEVTVVEVGNVDELSRSDVPHPGTVIVLLSFAFGPGRNAKAEQAAWRVRGSFAEARLVFLCDGMDLPSVSAAVRCGAVGFVDTASGPTVLAHCLRFVIVGGTALPSLAAMSADARPAPAADVPAERPSRFSVDLFTAKELDVLRCLGAGKPNKIIAYELNICETTVKVHMRHIMQKLGASNRTHAALLAVDLLS
jgi:DNA-binding NarL/FixJ family response regulator